MGISIYEYLDDDICPVCDEDLSGNYCGSCSMGLEDFEKSQPIIEQVLMLKRAVAGLIDAYDELYNRLEGH